MSIVIITTYSIVGIILVLLIVKYTSRPLLYLANINSKYVLFAQFCYLSLLLVLLAILGGQLRGAIPTLLRRTPVDIVEKYYAALNQGLTTGLYWDAYDLLSREQQQLPFYDKMRESYKKTQLIEITNPKVTVIEKERVCVVASVKRVFERHGMISEVSEQVYHNLSKEQGFWRLNSSIKGSDHRQNKGSCEGRFI